MAKKTKGFDYGLDFNKTDFRKHPELYRMGKREQGVLLVQPYKGELLPHWRFRTPEIASKSSAKLLDLFRGYRDIGDFVGMDMARKFLQMGYTRSRRYANHASGQKYKGAVPAEKKGQSGAHGRDQLPLDPDPVKAESAAIFYKAWQEAASDPIYQEAVQKHKAETAAGESQHQNSRTPKSQHPL